MVAYNIMFINNIPFVVSFSREVNFKMVDYVRRRLKTVLNKSIVKIFQFYKTMDIPYKHS